MRYKVSVRFNANYKPADQYMFPAQRIDIFEADGYATSDGVLRLFTHTPHPDAKIKIFPLENIQDISIEDRSA